MPSYQVVFNDGKNRYIQDAGSYDNAITYYTRIITCIDFFEMIGGYCAIIKFDDRHPAGEIMHNYLYYPDIEQMEV